MPELLLTYSFTSEANFASLLVFQTNLYETFYWKCIGILSQIQIFGSYSHDLGSKTPIFIKKLWTKFKLEASQKQVKFLNQSQLTWPLYVLTMLELQDHMQCPQPSDKKAWVISTIYFRMTLFYSKILSTY